MNPWLRSSYEATARVAELLSLAAPASGQSKVARTFAARRGLLTRYHAWADAKRDRSRPLLWIHAASVGEALMALPIIERVRAALPRTQIAFTFFSPSAEEFAATIPADFADYLPFDSRVSMRAAVQALAPTSIVFVKSDVWPNLVQEAHEAGVKLALVSASLPESSKRASRITGSLTRAAYATLDIVGAASADDAAQLARAGAREQRVRVTGDTRYDQAWARAHGPPRNAAIVDALASERPALVAGSTWPADERELLPAWLAVLRTIPRARLVLAPHELNARHIAGLEAWAQRANLRAARIDGDIAAADVVIIDRMGVLADIYAAATAAYVGGAFHAAGLHSLVEPAVFRVPAIIGPQHGRSRDARIMLAAGAIIAANDAPSLQRAIERVLGNYDERNAMADAMGMVVSDELGAADRSFGIVRELLGAVKKETLNEVYAK